MFFFGGRKQHWTIVPDGRIEVRRCPRCHATTRFAECELTTTYSAFFVDLLDLSDVVFMCTACHQVMPLDDTASPDLSHPDVAQVELEREEAAAREARERRCAERERAKAQAEREIEIERQLQALKKRMSRPGS